MKYLDNRKIIRYDGIGFRIISENDKVYFFNTTMNDSHYNDNDYINSLYDSGIFIDNIHSNILVIGLEIGCIPHWLSIVCPLSNIDVVESNKELITAVKSMEYLPKKIEIIHDDIFSHTPIIKYDVIITDMWWEIDNDTISDIQTLRENYNPYLKSNGKFHTPFIEPYIYEKITN